MRSSRLLIVLVVGLLAAGAGGCRVYLVPAGEAGPAPGNVEETEAPEDSDEATTGEETDDVEPANRDRNEDEDSGEVAAPVPRERPSADRDGEERSGSDGRDATREDDDAEPSSDRSRDRAEREADDSDRVAPRPRERPSRTASDDTGQQEDEGENVPGNDGSDGSDETEAGTSDGDELTQREARREARRRARRRARGLRVPPGHYPPEGQCRLWHAGRPPGQQPPAAPCEELADEELGSGVFVLYGGVAWDGSYDWEAVEMEHPGAVPRPVLMLVGSDG